MPYKIKLDIFIKKGAHTTEDESEYSIIALVCFVERFSFLFTVNKQINDKERIAAAMENPNLKEMVENCISEEDWFFRSKAFLLF